MHVFTSHITKSVTQHTTILLRGILLANTDTHPIIQTPCHRTQEPSVSVGSMLDRDGDREQHAVPLRSCASDNGQRISIKTKGRKLRTIFKTLRNLGLAPIKLRLTEALILVIFMLLPGQEQSRVGLSTPEEGMVSKNKYVTSGKETKVDKREEITKAQAFLIRRGLLEARLYRHAGNRFPRWHWGSVWVHRAGTGGRAAARIAGLACRVGAGAAHLWWRCGLRTTAVRTRRH